MATRTLTGFDLRNLWPSAWGASGKLVITLTKSVVSEDGVEYPATAKAGSSLRELGFHWESTITVTSSLATCASVSGLFNTDSAQPDHVAFYNVYVYDSRGRMREKLNSKPFHIHESLNNNASSFTWTQWVNANEFVQHTGDLVFIADRATVQGMIDGVVNAKANTSPSYGITALSVAPASASNPIAVGDNDPRLATIVNSQASNYTAVASDRNKLILFPNSPARTLTLPQPGVSFPDGWSTKAWKALGLGGLTITPTSSTIDGTASITIRPGSGVEVVSDGTNWYSIRGESSQIEYYVSNYQSLDNAVTTIGATRATLVVDILSAVGANLTIPSTLTLRFTNTGGIQPSNGVTVTIQGALQAPAFKIFYNSLAGQGTISFSGNSLQPFWTAQWWGTLADGVTDATTSVQAMINAVSTAGGGKMVFPAGTYLFNGALDGTENSVLTIPRVAVGAAQKTFIFEGEWNAFTASDSQPTSGVIWKTTAVTGSGTVPALIAARAFSVTSAASSFSFVTPIFRNIYFQTGSNPSISIVNMHNAANLMMENCQFDTGTTMGSQVEPTTATSYAILAPGINNYAQIKLSNISILGAFYNGIFASEHTLFDNVFVTRCKRALVFSDMNIPVKGSVYVTHAPTVIHCDNRAYFADFYLGFERDTGASWYSAGAGGAVEINKAGGVLGGQINYALNLVGVGPSTGALTHNIPANNATLVLKRVNAGFHVNGVSELVLGATEMGIKLQTEDGADGSMIKNVASGGANTLHLYGNIKYEGGTDRFDTGVSAVDLYIDPATRTMAFQSAAAGANPAVLTPHFSVSNSAATITPALAASTSIAVGSGGTAITLDKVYTPTLTPASVAANTSAEQDFTVAGLTTADKIIVNGPAPLAGTGIVNARVKAADTLSLTFGNYTAGALTPTSGTYTILAFRSA